MYMCTPAYTHTYTLLGSPDITRLSFTGRIKQEHHQEVLWKAAPPKQSWSSALAVPKADGAHGLSQQAPHVVLREARTSEGHDHSSEGLLLYVHVCMHVVGISVCVHVCALCAFLEEWSAHQSSVYIKSGYFPGSRNSLQMSSYVIKDLRVLRGKWDGTEMVV